MKGGDEKERRICIRRGKENVLKNSLTLPKKGDEMEKEFFKTKKVLSVFLITALLFLQLGSAAYAQEKYPGKAIQIIVPFGPGGSSDLFFAP